MSCKPLEPEDYLLDGYSVASFVCASVAASICIAGNVFIYIFQDRPVMRVSQSWMLHAYCLGFLLMNLSGVPRTLNSYYPFNTGLCLAQLWLVHPPLSFILAVLTAKETRAFLLRMHTRKLRRLQLPTYYVPLFIGSNVFVVVLIMLLWSLIPGFQPTLNACESFQCNVGESPFFWTIIAWELLQACLMLFVAWKDRRACGNIGSETKGILITTLSIVIALVLFTVTWFYNAPTAEDKSMANPNAVEALVSYAVFLVLTIIALISVVFFKAVYLNMNQADVFANFMSTNHSNKNPLGKKKAQRPRDTTSSSDHHTSCQSEVHLQEINHDHEGKELPTMQEMDIESENVAIAKT